jgi:hypothetical protein
MTAIDSQIPLSGTASSRYTVNSAPTDEVDELVNTTWGDRPPLPSDVYPRTFPKRAVTSGYYAAMGLWYFSSSVVPLAG